MALCEAKLGTHHGAPYPGYKSIPGGSAPRSTVNVHADTFHELATKRISPKELQWKGKNWTNYKTNELTGQNNFPVWHKFE